MRRKTLSIIGGGAAGMLLAAHIDTSRYNVTLFEKNKTLGRKFLVAGDGGLNLSYAIPLEDFIQDYIPSHLLRSAIQSFTQTDLRSWLSSLNIETFVSPSKKIFPVKGTKPIHVLQAILNAIERNNVKIEVQSEWKGWNSKKELIINDCVVKNDITVFALGGSSWKVTGSNGLWQSLFAQINIPTLSFQPSNCAFEVAWPSEFITKYAGSPLKNITATCEAKTCTGEIVITDFGIEGKASYALSPQVRRQLQTNNKATVYIDLKPTLSISKIQRILQATNTNITTTLKEKIKLDKTAIGLLKHLTVKSTFMDNKMISTSIKALPVEVKSLSGLDEAISTVGGISLDALDENYKIKMLPNQYCIGEMLDWDAPTGGYLLHGCMSMGVYLAKHLNRLH